MPMTCWPDRHPAEHRHGRAGRALRPRDVVRAPWRGPRSPPPETGRTAGCRRAPPARDARLGGDVLVPDDRQHGEQARHGYRRHGGQQQAVAHHGVAATTGTRADTSAGSSNGTSPEVIACCMSNTSSCGVICGPVLPGCPAHAEAPCRCPRRRATRCSRARNGPAGGGPTRRDGWAAYGSAIARRPAAQPAPPSPVARPSCRARHRDSPGLTRPGLARPCRSSRAGAW